MQKFKLKTLSVDGIQWTGKNTEDVINFLKEKGYTETKMERRVDTPIWVTVGSGDLIINRHEYVTVDEKGAIETHNESEFESLWELDNQGKTRSATIPDNSDAFRQFLREQNIIYTPAGSFTDIPVEIGVDLFNLGEQWAGYKRAHKPA